MHSPYVQTELSIPDGFPWTSFSASKLQLQINFRSWADKDTFVSPSVADTLVEGKTLPGAALKEGSVILPDAARSAVLRQTQYDADDPRPAPIGMDVFTSTENEGSLETKWRFINSDYQSRMVVEYAVLYSTLTKCLDHLMLCICSPFTFLHNATHQENKHSYGILDKPLIHFCALTMVHKLVEQLSSFCCATWHICTLDTGWTEDWAALTGQQLKQYKSNFTLHLTN